MTAKKKAEETARIFPKFEDLCLPPDENVEDSTTKLTLYKLRMSRESANTFVLRNSVLGDITVPKGANMIFLHASNYWQCNCERNGESSVNECFSYDYSSGFSTKGYKCKDKCPYKANSGRDGAYRRIFKYRIYFLVETPSGSWELAEFTAKINTANEFKTFFSSTVRQALFAKHRLTSASHAIVHVNYKKETADWDKSIKLNKLDTDNYEIVDTLTSEEQDQINSLIGHIKHFEEETITSFNSRSEVKYNKLIATRMYPFFSDFFPELAVDLTAAEEPEEDVDDEVKVSFEVPTLEAPKEEESTEEATGEELTEEDALDGMPEIED